MQTRAIPRNNEKKGSEDGNCRARRRTQAGWRPSRTTTQPCNPRTAELFSVFLGIALIRKDPGAACSPGPFHILKRCLWQALLAGLRRLVPMAAAAGGAVSIAVPAPLMAPPQGPDGQGHDCGQGQENDEISQNRGHTINSLQEELGQILTPETDRTRRCSSSGRQPLRTSRKTIPASRTRAATVPRPKLASPVTSPPSWKTIRLTA